MQIRTGIAALQIALVIACHLAADPGLKAGVLDNGLCRATINLSRNHVDFGTVASFFAAEDTGNLVRNGCFGLHAGSTYHSRGEILAASRDTIRIALEGFGALGLHAVLTYFLDEQSLQVDARIWVDKSTEFNDGLEFDIGTGLQKISITSPNLTTTHVPFPPSGCTNSDLNPIVSFSDTCRMAQFLIRNPFHAFWRFDSTGSGLHQLEVVKCLRPAMRTIVNLEAGPVIGSTIGANDTICRHVEVFCNSTINDLFYLGEHVDGYTPSITLAWDELPNSDNWRFMTTADARDVVVDHFLVRLLNDHPKLKMGYVLVADRILHRRNAEIQGWVVNSPYVQPDSLTEYAGAWCLHFMQVRESNHTVSASVPCKPSRRYSLSWFLKTESIQSGETGAFVRVSGSGSAVPQTNNVTVNGTTDWKCYKADVISGVTDTLLTVTLGISSCSGGSAWFDDVVLTDDSGNNLMTNGGFETNYPYYHYDTTRRHWVDAHGREHIVSAPESYKAFLRRIENDSVLYGWEHRVRLGAHGYHHTPSIDKTDSIGLGWEFQHYDPDGDKQRVAMVYRDFYQIGLTKKSLLFWRAPGVQYTKSLVDLLVDSGVVFMDPYFTDHDFDVRSCFIERNGRRIWFPDLAFWTDYKTQFSLEKLKSYLKNGHLGHIGGHPGPTFFCEDTIAPYNFFHKVLTDFEAMYPNLGYVFPDEYGENANAVYELSFGAVRHKHGSINIEVVGRTTGRNTLIAYGTFAQVVWNGAPVTTINSIGNLTYIVLPRSDNLTNNLALKRSENHSGGFTLGVQPARYDPPATTVGEMILYDLHGRILQRIGLNGAMKDTPAHLDTMLRKVARGMYVCSVLHRGKRVKTHIVVNYGK